MQQHCFPVLMLIVTTEGRPYFGAAIGFATYIQEFVYEKVASWSEEIIQLAKFAQVQPHAAAFTHGLSMHVVQCPIFLNFYNLSKIKSD